VQLRVGRVVARDKVQQRERVVAHPRQQQDEVLRAQPARAHKHKQTGHGLGVDAI